jgi:hypothetical protein
MPRIVHFEIPAKDPEKVSKFYTDTFGWEIKKWGGESMDYWLVMTGDKKEMGIDGGIYKKSDKMKEVVNTVGVTDVKASVEMVEKNGGSVMGEIQEIPGVGMFVYAMDPEGNKFGMMQPFPDAKMM